MTDIPKGLSAMPINRKLNQLVQPMAQTPWLTRTLDRKMKIPPDPTSLSDVLEYALLHWDSFSLVQRDGFDFNQSAKDFIQKLSPYKIKEETVSRWPGTDIFKAKALLVHYEVKPGSIAVLKTVDGIFSFLSPDLPEDLAFYSDGKTVYSSVAHEEMAWLED